MLGKICAFCKFFCARPLHAYSSLAMSVLLAVAQPTYSAAETVSFNVAASVALKSYQGLVEDHLSGILRTERAVAMSSDAKSGRWDLIKPILDRLGKDTRTASAVWFALPDGKYFTTEKGVIDQNLKDRSYFSRLMDGKDVIGELVISKSTGLRSIIVAAPVMVDGKVVAAIGVSIGANLLAQFVDENTAMSEDMYYYALNSDTKISMHRYIDRIFRHPSDIGDEALGEAFSSVLSKDMGVFPYELNGEKISSIFQKSQVTGWHFFLAKKSRK